MNTFLGDKMRIFCFQILIGTCLLFWRHHHLKRLNFGQLLSLFQMNINYLALIFHLHFSVFFLCFFNIKNNL